MFSTGSGKLLQNFSQSWGMYPEEERKETDRLTRIQKMVVVGGGGGGFRNSILVTTIECVL